MTILGATSRDPRKRVLSGSGPNLFICTAAFVLENYWGFTWSVKTRQESLGQEGSLLSWGELFRCPFPATDSWLLVKRVFLPQSGKSRQGIYQLLLFLAVSSDDMWRWTSTEQTHRRATAILMFWKPGSVQRWLHHAPEPLLPQARTSVHQPASNISVNVTWKLPHTFSTMTKLITLSTTWFYSRRHNIGVRRVSPSLSLADH